MSTSNFELGKDGTRMLSPMCFPHESIKQQPLATVCEQNLSFAAHQEEL